MKIFGKTISVKKFGCSVNGEPGMKISPEVNLYVRVTNGCNARCAFCSNGPNSGRVVQFDRFKLLGILDELEGNDVTINRLSITGGEPGTVRGLVEEILDDLSGAAYSHIPVTLSTNGLSRDSRELIRHPRWYDVCMSVHHYDYGLMSDVYGLSEKIDRFDFSDIERGKLSFNCNLIRGMIDSQEEMVRMMVFAHECGIGELGFSELMPVNAYCREHHVDIDGLDLSEVKHLVKDRESKREGVCCCRNYLYFLRGRVLSVYLRANRNPLYCESSLLYDGQNLSQGFQSENVIC